MEGLGRDLGRELSSPFFKKFQIFANPWIWISPLGTYDYRFGVEKYALDLTDKLMIFSSIQSQEGF